MSFKFKSVEFASFTCLDYIKLAINFYFSFTHLAKSIESKLLFRNQTNRINEKIKNSKRYESHVDDRAIHMVDERKLPKWIQQNSSSFESGKKISFLKTDKICQRRFKC